MKNQCIVICLLASSGLTAQREAPQAQDTPDLNPQYHLCEGETATLVAIAYTGSGTVLPVQYDWDHINGDDDPQEIQVTPVKNTTYKVKVTDANKQKLDQKHDVIIEKVSIDQVRTGNTCPDKEDGVIEIRASGNGLSYSFDGGGSFGTSSEVRSLRAGDYEVLVQNDFGCKVSQNITIDALSSDDKSCKNEEPPNISKPRKYSTNRYHFAALKENLDYNKQRKKIAKKQRKWRRIAEFENYEFEVVFHFLTGDDKDTAEELVTSQLSGLNRDFGKPDLASYGDTLYHHLAVDMMMSFSLAPNGIIIKPKADPSSIATTLSEWNEIKGQNNKGSTPKSPDKYINIWVTDFAEDTYSYAQMPGGLPDTDGIVIDRQYFGVSNNRSDVYNDGKTLTHLMGSFFGLKPLSGWSRCADDGAHDTPIHNLPYEICYDNNLTSTCDGRRAMQENFMSAAPDACQYMFTRDQRHIVHGFLYSDPSRFSLIQNK